MRNRKTLIQKIMRNLSTEEKLINLSGCYQPRPSIDLAKPLTAEVKCSNHVRQAINLKAKSKY